MGGAQPETAVFVAVAYDLDSRKDSAGIAIAVKPWCCIVLWIKGDYLQTPAVAGLV